MTSIHGRSDLVEAMIHPGLEEAHEALIEVFEEMDGQLDKETKRLKELNEIREKDHGTLYLFFCYIDRVWLISNRRILYRGEGDRY